MKRGVESSLAVLLCVIAVASAAAYEQGAKPSTTDSEIRQILIKESISRSVSPYVSLPLAYALPRLNGNQSASPGSPATVAAPRAYFDILSLYLDPEVVPA